MGVISLWVVFAVMEWMRSQGTKRRWKGSVFGPGLGRARVHREAEGDEWVNMTKETPVLSRKTRTLWCHK